MRFSLVIPCYNEAKSLPELVNACIRAGFDSRFEIIFVDNGSTDNTPQLLPKLIASHSQFKTIRVEENKGYGHGILQGLRASQGEVIGWTHADLQTDPSDLLSAVPFFNEDKAVFAKGQRYGRPFFDMIFTVGMSFFEMFLLRKFFWDINAQPTMFSREFFEKWEDPPHDFSLDLFAYFLAKDHKLAIRRFPVYFGKRQYGDSHWNVDWKGKYKFIRRTIKFSLELKKKYKNATHCPSH